MHAPKSIPITADTVLDAAGTPPPLGPIGMFMPEGPATCYDARSCTVITGSRPTTGDKFVVVIGVAEIEGEVIGTMAQMTPKQARTFAASMLRAADECDA